jgi:hypothetical protein
LDVLDEPELQLAQWGGVRFARGPWPNNKPKHLPGSPEADDKKADDWAAVWGLPYGEVRNARRAELRVLYGFPPTASMTLGFEPGGAPR